MELSGGDSGSGLSGVDSGREMSRGCGRWYRRYSRHLDPSSSYLSSLDCNNAINHIFYEH